MYINAWEHVPDGSRIVEDTYNEVYEIFTRDGKRYIRQVGWQVPTTRAIDPYERELTFFPNAPYSQPWVVVG